MSLVYLNGKTINADEARVSVFDRGFLLGDGLFETMRSYGGEIFRLEDHLQRLARSRAELNLAQDDEEDLGKAAQALMEKNGCPDARIRITVSRGMHGGSMGIPKAGRPTALVTAEPLPASFLEGEVKTIRAASTSIRSSDNNPIFKHKTLNRLPHMIARQEAEQKGADEAMLLDEKGNVAAMTTGNIFVVQYGQLFTPPDAAPILCGVTRKVVLELALGMGLKIRRDFFSPIMLAGAEEAFMTNSVVEIAPIQSVDGNPVGSGRIGPVTSKIIEKYKALARGRD